MKKNILFWTSVLFLADMLAIFVLEIYDLRMRVWLRKAFVLTIVLGTAAGSLQWILRIPKQASRLAGILLWSAGVVFYGMYGVVLLACYCHTERTETYKGIPCVVETDRLQEHRVETYYESHGWFVRSMEALYTRELE